MADEDSGGELIWLAMGVVALAWFFRPVGDSMPLDLVPSIADSMPLDLVPSIADSMPLQDVTLFDPAADLGTVTVTPFVEHFPGETVTGPAPTAVALPLSSLPVGTIRLNNGQYQLPTGELVGIPIAPATVIESVLPLAPAVVDPGPWTEAQTWAWITTRPVIVLYPELAQRLYDDLKANTARGIPGQPWFSIAALEVWVKGHGGYTFPDGRQIAPGYITTEYGTPDNLPYGFINDGTTVHYDPVLYNSLTYQAWLNAQGRP